MPNFAASLRGTGICGMPGSGKTTLAFCYLQNAPVSCRFIFDDRGQAAARLRLPHASTEAELERALATRWVCYNPHQMFPGDPVTALKFFCRWTYAASKRGPGHKLCFVDEVYRHCTPTHIPVELAVIAQEGRVEDLELVTATQRPHKWNESLMGQMTELICFRLQHRLALQALTDLDIGDADIERVRRLPLGSFISFNLEKGSSRTGKVF